MKVADLTDAALDWAVAKCEGYVARGVCKADRLRVLVPHPDGGGRLYRPSTDWEQGGCIIAREGINTFIVDDSGPFIWRAEKADPFGALRRKGISLQSHTGSTPLVAAMRCYVASKLGDEIELPKELLR